MLRAWHRQLSNRGTGPQSSRSARPRLLELESRLAPGITFSGVSAITLPASSGPIAVASSDLNGDTIPDLVVTAGTSTAGKVLVLQGLGNGTFDTSSTKVTTDSDPTFAAVADVTGDGRPDVIVPSQIDGEGV